MKKIFIGALVLALSGCGDSPIDVSLDTAPGLDGFSPLRYLVALPARWIVSSLVRSRLIGVTVKPSTGGARIHCSLARKSGACWFVTWIRSKKSWWKQIRVNTHLLFNGNCCTEFYLLGKFGART